ncbi:sulfate ABC transporter substrate-binding protein [Cohnella thailandensis]|uniref:Sulfate ABC transporter substrate-binding protein n=1 Tax=Cohnella thailandensis TaxID=557557 RepID=A0A841SQW8_9BACL|nr:sulfate ABC transporter substrate-binding protein [Cohnella thailandensis]MBB6633592.1 sulfate ABC transporter substrate-binding protein [Cohnella thailandensis]MBP1974611.1 sulfate transport system substrate-binding protein [Cohnella thailandensis]
MQRDSQHSDRRRRTGVLGLASCLLLAGAVAGCGNGAEEGAGASPSAGSGAGQAGKEVTLVIGAYSVAKDALQEILPRFGEEWKEKTGQDVKFQESYEASGTQARAIAGGFEADVAVLSMEGDMDKITKAGLMGSDWKNGANGGMITRSIVVMGTREGNPKGIKDFDDLTKPGIKVLYPNPQTSGGAQWDINALYGAGLMKSEEETGSRDEAAAKRFLVDIHKNIESMDKSGRASMAAFEYGVGDVIVTYENELLARVAQGVHYDIVTPSRTILIENPAAVVDENADKHGVREAADAFVEFLHGDVAQEIFAENGFRPVSENVAAKWDDSFAQPEKLFDIGYLGGWDEVRSKLYSDRGIWYQVLAGQ